MAQNRSGFSPGAALSTSPSAVAISTARRLSQARPWARITSLMPPPQGESGDPRGRHLTTRCGQAESLGGSVQLSPRDTSLGPGGPGSGINGDQLHGGEIDDEPVIAQSATGHLVPTAPDAHRRPELSGHPNGRHHVVCAAAACHGGGTPVHEPVPNLMGLLVAGMSGVDDLSPEGGSQGCHEAI